MDYKELLESCFQKSEEVARLRASLLYLQYLYEGEEDKRLLLDEKQYRMIMDMAGIKVDKEVNVIKFDNCEDIAYAQKLES